MAVLALVMLPSGIAVKAADRPHHKIVTARKLDNLESRLRETAAEGYRLIGSGSGVPVARQRGMIHLLLESLPESLDPPEYFVVGESGYLRAGGLDAMQERGAKGFGVAEHGVIDRPRQTPMWAPLPLVVGMQSVIIMEATRPTSRWEYAVERFPRAPGEWDALASRHAEGYHVVAVTQTDGALLARRAGEQSDKEVAPDRFIVISSLRKKKLATKLGAAATDGYRLVAQLFGVIKGGSYDLLLEKVAGDDLSYEYRLLPWRGDRLSMMNLYGSEGFHVHSAAWWIMEREPAAGKINHEYRVLEATSTDELAEAMDGAASEGYRFVQSLFPPCRLLVERSRPGGGRRQGDSSPDSRATPRLGSP